jgi:hypothetical protein
MDVTAVRRMPSKSIAALERKELVEDVQCLQVRIGVRGLSIVSMKSRIDFDLKWSDPIPRYLLYNE